MLEHFEGLPKTVRALAEKYPACLCGDFSGCRHTKTREMLEKIIQLVTSHPRYEIDDGSEVLWADLAKVALSAYHDGDSVVEAIDTFLDACLAELPEEDRMIPIQ